MKNYLRLAFFVLFAVTSMMVLQAKGAPDISINNVDRELIAPAGQSYQWYHNGELIIGAVAETFSPEESGTYRVEVTDGIGNVSSSSIVVSVTTTGIRKVHLIGDSTVSNYGANRYPFKGWGQVFQWFFDDSLVQVENHARGGRSSRSFYQEGLWTPVKNSLDSGDYVLIQFGHNDRDFSRAERYTSPDSMKHFLRIYINDTRAEGAIPILVSPMSMNTGTRNVFTESGSDYRGAMMDVAAELNVPFLDLNMKSWNFYQQIGVEYAQFFVHMGLLPGEYSNYPDGYEDYWTHYQEMGALAMCQFLAEEIMDQAADPELAFLDSALKPLYTVAVELNKANAGLSTVTSRFPEGATVTLKSRLTDPNDQLQYWEDSSNNVTLNGNLVTFTMEDHDYDFIGYITDCNGTSGGTATIDECGVCSGGETGIDPCTEYIPCIDICETNAKVALTLDPADLYHLTLSTEGIAQAYLEQDVEVAAADSFLIAIIYDNPTAGESVNVYVDGTLALSEVPLNVTSGWEIQDFKLELGAGAHTVRIENTSSTGGARYDYLALFSSEVSGVECEKDHFQETTFGQTDTLIVMEAENYTNLFPASNGSEWTKALMDDASSGEVIIAPEGVSYGSAGTAEYNAPVSRYHVDFPHTGKYYIWARVYAFNPTSDSYHLGLDADLLIPSIDLYNSTNVYDQFTWMHVSNQSLPVNNTGIQGLDVFCREPHLIIDKIVLSQDPSYTPSGMGPEETPVDFAWTTSIHDAQAVALNLMAYPNPASSEIHVEFTNPDAGMVNVSVYNMTGQKIQELVNGFQTKGTQHLNWEFGNTEISAGLYLIRVQTATGTQVQRVRVNR